MDKSFLEKVSEILKRDYDVKRSELKDFVYCGGNNGSHLNYYKKVMKGKPLLPEKCYCICGHEIKKNCYVKKDNIIIILGRCCIKRFLPKDAQGRTCEKCKQPHKNRKVNRCNKCRLGMCDDCNTSCSVLYKQCYNCYQKKNA